MPLDFMRLRSQAAQWFPFLAPKKSLPRGEALALRPIRNPVVQWERRAKKSEDDDPDSDAEMTVALTIPRRENKWDQMLSRFFPMPSSKTIELDIFGSEIWELCDGAHTVETMVGRTSAQYKLNRRQSEISVTTFMRMLMERRLIGFVNPPSQEKIEGKSATYGNPKRRVTAVKRQRRSGGPHSRRH